MEDYIEGDIVYILSDMNSTIDYIELVSRENIINEDQVPADNSFASSTHIEGGYLEREAFDLNTNSQWRSQFPCADTNI